METQYVILAVAIALFLLVLIAYAVKNKTPNSKPLSFARLRAAPISEKNARDIARLSRRHGLFTDSMVYKNKPAEYAAELRKRNAINASDSAGLSHSTVAIAAGNAAADVTEHYLHETNGLGISVPYA
jgi:hypothetical protein